MNLFEKLEAANREYMAAMKDFIEITNKETKIRLQKEKIRQVYVRAKDEMWALEQEAKEFKIYSAPLTDAELKMA
jgi:hypothetical protein